VTAELPASERRVNRTPCRCHPRGGCRHQHDADSAEGMIVTAGAIETHAHLISPQQTEHALSTGTTTLIGGRWGPSFEVATGSPRNLGMFLKAGEYTTMNFVAFGRGSSDPDAVLESVVAGAWRVVKIHEDLGASPAVIDKTLEAADSADFAGHLHTDSINEFGFPSARCRRSGVGQSKVPRGRRRRRTRPRPDQGRRLRERHSGTTNPTKSLQRSSGSRGCCR